MAVDATVGIVDTVEQMHRTIQQRPAPLGVAAASSSGGATGLVYRGVRGGLRLAGQGLEAMLAPLAGLLPEAESSARRDAVVAAVNGVHGDYLERTGNPLAIRMALRHRGRTIDVLDPRGSLAGAGSLQPSARLLVLVHGLCMNDLQWSRDGFDHGASLAAEFDYTPLYLRYNSGLPVGVNGQRLAMLLEDLVAHWPVPVEELTIVGHSMGGLVARGACHVADTWQQAWRHHLRNLFFLCTPHHGAPLERGGHGLFYLIDLSPYLAPFTRLGKSISAGIQDLRHGSVTTGEYRFVPLPAGVRCHAVAATLAARRGLLADRLVGDGLVPLDSALGRHADKQRTLAFAKDHQWHGHEMGHLELLRRPEVHAQLRLWLRAASANH
jgi:pimeloyl-ACP methyl ester carboxylesterase